MLKVNEIFYSIQGEGTSAGLPCIFIRLTYCNLRCTYCDTEYAFYEGREYSIEQIIKEIEKYDCVLVQITGGEPLVQKESIELMARLADMNYIVLLETGGSLSIGEVDQRVKIIMDIKTPSSKMEKKNLYSNIESLKKKDEIKFVVGDREDYEWTKEIIKKYDLINVCDVLISPVFGAIEPGELAEWILRDSLKVRFQVQLHKIIWGPERRGV